MIKLKYRLARFLKVAFLSVFFVACSEGFLTSFQEIEHDKLRPLAFVFDKSEMAPGDTVRFHGHFAGLPLRGDFEASLAVNVQTSPYGEEYVSGIVPIAQYLVETSEHPIVVEDNYISFSFVVPEDIFLTSGVIPVADRENFMGFVEEFLTGTDFSGETVEMQKFAALVAQITTVRMFLMLEVNGGSLKIERELAVRYNSRINNNPFVRVNNNPEINWIGLYKVRLNDGVPIVHFTPENIQNDYTFQYVYIAEGYEPCVEADFSSTIVVEDGFAYFFEIDSGFNCGIRTRDSAMIVSYSDRQLATIFSSLEAGDFSVLENLSQLELNFTEIQENYYFDFFFQQDANEIVGVANSDQMLVSGTFRENIFALTVPRDERITQANLWLKTQDWVLGERMRPFASDFVEFQVVFEHR